MKKMTDKDIWALIEETEREGMIDPPAGFQDEVIWQIRKKRKHKKDMQLFSYSTKVFMTMAATLFILFAVPETFNPKEWISEQWMTEQTETEQEDNDRQTKAEQSGSAREKWTADADRILNKFNQTLDRYCSKMNDGLDQLVKRRK